MGTWGLWRLFGALAAPGALLCAVAAYLLFRLYCSERVTDALRPVAVGSRSLPAVDR